MMDDYRTGKTEIPGWMCRQEEYTPSADKETFLTRSTKSVLSVLSRLRFDEGKDGRFSATPSLKLLYTVLYIILTACSRNYLFVLIMCAAVTVRLAFFPASAIRQILSGTAGAVMISIFLLLPAVFMGNPQTLANITARVYVSATLVGILSAGTSWNKLTASMRSVGKNPDKAKSFSGILGITFLKSSEMAEEMYASMCCRGGTGEYQAKQKYKMRLYDIVHILIVILCVVLFIHLN